VAKSGSKWHPEGQADDQILASLLTEATAIIERFERIAARHSSEIENFRNQHPRNGQQEDLERWKEVTLLKNLFEVAEPAEFDFDFHERRRVFLDLVESGADIDIGSTFIDICMLAGLRPLYAPILNAHEFERLLYSATDARSSLTLDPSMYDLLEFNVTLLRLYADARRFYGAERFLLLLQQAKS
jgi:hypothetical protein